MNEKEIEFEYSSVGNPKVYLVWEQTPLFVSLRAICSSKRNAELRKKTCENEYSKIKKRRFFIDNGEIDHLYGSIEMYNLTQEEKTNEENLIKDLKFQLQETEKNYGKAIKYIRFLEGKRSE